MLKQSEVTAEEERLRVEVRKLTDAQRQQFYALAQPRIKDPDTYAAMNYLFVAGLHHFYLGQWLRAILTPLLYLLGLAMLFDDSTRWPGVALIVAITVLELYELFRSQVIVQHFNNQAIARVLDEIAGRSQ